MSAVTAGSGMESVNRVPPMTKAHATIGNLHLYRRKRQRILGLPLQALAQDVASLWPKGLLVVFSRALPKGMLGAYGSKGLRAAILLSVARHDE